MEKNFFHIEGTIDLVDVIDSLHILKEEGILFLMGVTEPSIEKKLEKFKIGNIDFPDIGKSLTIGFFKRIEEKNIAIKFDTFSKKELIDIVNSIFPDVEICSYLYYLAIDKKEILEYVVDSDIYISRYVVDDDEVVREFCKSISINRYCLEEFCEI